MEHPLPLSRRVTEDVFPCEQSSHPHRPAARAASSRPLPRGRAVSGDSPDTVHGEQELDFGEGDRVDGREVVSPLAVCLWDIASVGVGLTGRGMEHPLPCPDVSLKTFFHASSQATPPPPGRCQGGGLCNGERC